LPDSGPKGSFVISVIKDYDWEISLYHKQTKDLEMLDTFVGECRILDHSGNLNFV